MTVLMYGASPFVASASFLHKLQCSSNCVRLAQITCQKSKDRGCVSSPLSAARHEPQQGPLQTRSSNFLSQHAGIPSLLHLFARVQHDSLLGETSVPARYASFKTVCRGHRLGNYPSHAAGFASLSLTARAKECRAKTSELLTASLPSLPQIRCSNTACKARPDQGQ